MKFPFTRKTATEQDNELIERVRRGDRKAWEMIYKTNRWLQKNSIRQYGTEADAEDIYQNAMLALYENIISGRLQKLDGRLSTYLYGIVRNQAGQLLRSFRPKSHELPEHVQEEVPVNIAREDAFLQRQIDRLDDRCRQILLLFYFEKQSAEDIGPQVGIPVDSVRKRKYECLTKLKDLARRYRNTEYDE
ncbi:hypothetical protein GCM10023187_11820 [Nibrella viscosa]|uniref:RNA polymerase sigma factor, sigma-70 family n=1 Tax=Nibrella viscosa TaxID=1084524 RepID=A0ABP8K3A9_9BACT